MKKTNFYQAPECDMLVVNMESAFLGTSGQDLNKVDKTGEDFWSDFETV